MQYPKARKGDVIEEYHSIKVTDPYRWLEDPYSEETKQWVKAENKITDDFLNNINEREKIRERLTTLWDYPKRSIPFHKNNKFYLMKNNGLQNQSVLYVQDSLADKPRILLNPNTWSEEGTSHLGNWEPSKDGKYLAFTISEKGSDWQHIKIMNIETSEELSEVIHWCKFTSLEWNKESSGFFYGRYPKPSGGLTEDENSNNRVYFHRIGTSQEEDVLVHEDAKDKNLHFGIDLSGCREYIIIGSMKGTGSKNQVHYKKIDDKDFIPLFEKEDAQYSFINNFGTMFYFQTDKDAPKRRIISINIENKEVKEIIPEQEDTLSFAMVVNHKLVVVYVQKAHNILKIYDKGGNFEQEVKLPLLGTIGNIYGEKDQTELFFSLTSFTSPSTIYRFDFNKLEEYYKSSIKFDGNKYETKQVFYLSKDRTKVSMFITTKKDVELNGKNPTLIHGYGGFNIPVLPSFSVSVANWLEMGGIYVETNLRGGSEYGSKWHEDGMLGKKQNVFDDFIGAAEYLIEKGYTSNKKIAIIGGSNGGLLVAACMTQRPDLYGAVICQVPVIDMLRFHKFTVGKYWIEEYGCAEKEKDFGWLYKYSPLHNIKETSHPSTLIWTGDHDDRVVSAHAKKFAATLQEKDNGTNPLLLHIETAAGHGMGKPTKKVIDERTKMYSFLFKELRMK